MSLWETVALLAYCRFRFVVFLVKYSFNFNCFFQPSVNMKLALKNKGSTEEKDNKEEDTLDLTLDLAAFDKLRFNVAKAVSCTEAYTQN